MADRAHPLAASAAGSSDCPAVQLAALPPTTRLIIRGDASVPAMIGLAVPDTCRATTFGGNALLWLGPDEFLLLVSDGAAPLLANSVDVSHRDTALAVSGPRAAWVINAFCALDLHPAAFPVGMCTRTVLGKAEIVLWRIAAETFRIEVARSFAPYVWACLEEARREFVA
jgi:heterotetrameric sarcosine oxidase gamma subunit